MRIGPGHAILVEPDGRAGASPVWQAPDCLEPFGNQLDDRRNQHPFGRRTLTSPGGPWGLIQESALVRYVGSDG
jgi:hypothetical protein